MRIKNVMPIILATTVLVGCNPSSPSKEVTLKSIEASLKSTKTYSVNETISKNDIKVIGKYSDDSSKEIESSKWECLDLKDKDYTFTLIDGDKKSKDFIITSSNSTSYTLKVNVNESVHVTEVTLNQKNLFLLPDETFTLEATIKPDNASVKDVKWTSSNVEIASVDKGVVTAHKEGNVTITVTSVDGGKTAECDVTVDPTPTLDCLQFEVIDATTCNVSYSKDTSYEPKDGLVVIPRKATIENTVYTVTEVKANGFNHTSKISTIKLPNTITKLNNYAFYNLSKLTSVVLPESLTSIGEYAFQGCASLETVNIPKNVSNIDDNAFNSCSNLKIFNVDNQNSNFVASTPKKDILFELNNKKIDKIISHPSATGELDLSSYTDLTTIGWAVYAANTNITSVKLPKSVTTIKPYAFNECTAIETFDLTSYNSESTIPTIGEKAFGSFKGQFKFSDVDTLAKFEKDSSWSAFKTKFIIKDIYEEGKLVFDDFSASEPYTCSVKAGTNCPSEVAIPSTYTKSGKTYTVNKIAESGFYNKSITKVFIPSTIEEIDSSAFLGDQSLTDVIFSSSSTLKTIGNYAFQNDRALKKIDLPDSVTSIGEAAFNNSGNAVDNFEFNINKETSQLAHIYKNAFCLCTTLKSINIPSSLTNIEQHAFANCSNLTKFNVASGHSMYEAINDGKILFHKDSKIICFYPSATGSVDLSSEASGVLQIEAAAFSGCSTLTSITIPSTITFIGLGAFYNCYHLTSITSYSSSYPAESGILYGNSSKTIIHSYPSATGALNIANTITKINDFAFYNTGITSITLPDSVADIGNDSFKACLNLKNVTIENSTVAAYDNPGGLFTTLSGSNKKVVKIPTGTTPGTTLTNSYNKEVGNPYDTYTQK